MFLNTFIFMLSFLLLQQSIFVTNEWLFTFQKKKKQRERNYLMIIYDLHICFFNGKLLQLVALQFYRK